MAEPKHPLEGANQWFTGSPLIPRGRGCIRYFAMFSCDGFEHVFGAIL